MIEAVSCGGVVIHRWKILLLYKNQNGRYMGWVLPKGTVEENETYRQTALREVKEESGANGEIIKYVGKTQYTFKGGEDTVNKTVHWYLMSANSFTANRRARSTLQMRVFINSMRLIICSNSTMSARF